MNPIMNPNMTIDRSLVTFIDGCNVAIQHLESARSTEQLDACTSNNSIIGFLISCNSSSKNYRVSHMVDQLQLQAQKINEMIRASGILGIGVMAPLNTYFNGEGVRQAESAEHSFFANLLTSFDYSSVASMRTIAELSSTLERVRAVRDQAQYMRHFLMTNQSPSVQITCNPTPAPVPYCAPVYV